MEFELFLKFAIAGTAGGLCHDLLKHRRVIIFPGRWANGKAKGWDLGTLSSIIIGVAVAVMVDHNPVTAFSSAVAGPEILEQFTKINKNRTFSLIRRFIDAVDNSYSKD